ncbi:MAG: FAD-dependent oxidoreductase [Oscillatoria princeps RMCB-10]|jgi:predicted NAD/FAD-dependent oxidoreductase|nr:FAD-dependent oxidoreductase [Oscillatoria princeps RMCB-10]
MAASDDILDVAVIGAGIAGLTCAQLLRMAGYSVAVVEKSRGLGGRVATRRLQGTCADHGARYLQPTGLLLRRLVQVLCDRKIIEPWTDTIYEVGSDLHPHMLAAGNWCTYYTAPAGMSAIGKFLGTDLDIWLNRRVASIAPTGSQTWHLTAEATDSAADPPKDLTAKAVVVAIPAPQALTLLEPNQGAVPLDFLNKLRSVEFDPCISVMAGYPADRQRDLARRDTAWRAVAFPSDERLAWVGWDSSKRPASEVPVFVLQSTPAFAQGYLDAEDFQPAGEQLLARAAKYLLPWLDSPDWVQVHRWRYAFARRPLPEACLSAQVPVPVVCCGDWCGGNLVEGALASGIAAAGWVNGRLQGLTLPGVGFWDAIGRE